MYLFNRPISAARTALIYITVGVLTDIWSGIWYFFLANHPPVEDFTWYWCYGFLLTGLALVIIGSAIGQIGRSARHAEPPPEVLVAPPTVRPPEEVVARPAVAVPVHPAVTGTESQRVTASPRV
jgi:hypothetical protein